MFRPPAPLCGLNPAARYVAWTHNRHQGHCAGGYELMTTGIPGDAGKGVGYSRTLFLEQIA
jgi:hypothetical protein